MGQQCTVFVDTYIKSFQIEFIEWNEANKREPQRCYPMMLELERAVQVPTHIVGEEVDQLPYGKYLAATVWQIADAANGVVNQQVIYNMSCCYFRMMVYDRRQKNENC